MNWILALIAVALVLNTIMVWILIFAVSAIRDYLEAIEEDQKTILTYAREMMKEDER